MSLDPKNVIQLTGGLVADPETVGNNGNILKFRLAVDRAGNEDGGTASGYFDITYFTNNDENQRNAKFVKDQIAAGNLKKGSQVSLVGRLMQDRWTTDDKKNFRVVVVAEAITYAGSAKSTNEAKTDSPAQSELPDAF